MVFFTSQIMPRKSGEISGGWPEKIVGGPECGGVKDSGGSTPSRKYVNLENALLIKLEWLL